jgi:hypothetical protein
MQREARREADRPSQAFSGVIARVPVSGVQEWRAASSRGHYGRRPLPAAGQPTTTAITRMVEKMASRRVGTAPFSSKLLASGTGGDTLRAANNGISSSFGREFIEAFRA